MSAAALPDPRLAAAAAAASHVDPSRRPRSDEGYNPNAKRTKLSSDDTQDTSQLGLGQPDQFGNHPDGSWTCPHCGNVNWPRRTVCNNRRCGRPKVEGATAAAALDSDTPPGSWVCPLCNNLNWPKRTSCNRCKASKAACLAHGGPAMGGMGMGLGMGGGMPPPPIAAAPIATPTPTGSEHPDGSWTCHTCGNVNWPRRTVCNRNGCTTKRPEVMDLHLQTQIQALQMLAMQDPANAHVYLAQLEQLQIASRAPPPVTGGGLPIGGGGGMGRGGVQHPPGSWACPDCDNINWPKRMVCNRKGCDTPRPANAGIPPSQEIGGGAAAGGTAVGASGGGGAPASYPGGAGGYAAGYGVSYAGASGGYGGAASGGYGGAASGGYGGAGGYAGGYAATPPKQNHPEGSWVCPRPGCQNVNWPMRTVCNRRGCDEPRPPQ